MTKSDFMTSYIVDGAKNGNTPTMKDAEEAWKAHREENGFTSPTGYFNDFLARLEGGWMNDESFNTLVGELALKKQGRNHLNKVRMATNAIHQKYIEGSNFEV
jgi:hypothetical protein